MTQRITILTASDLHRDKSLYEQLKTAVEKHRPDILALVGDFLDATRTTGGKFTVTEAAAFLSKLSVPDILIIRGNHEDSGIWTFENEWRQAGKEFHLLERTAFVYGPLVVIGFPCLMGCVDNIIDPISSQPHKWLPVVVQPIGPAARTLWLMHEPPCGTNLSKREGVLSGNPEWMEAVERYSPWLVIFGHDHDTPAKKKQWNQTLPNKTVCVNVGQDSSLRYCKIDLEFPDNRPCLPTKVKITAYPKGESIQLPRRS